MGVSKEVAFFGGLASGFRPWGFRDQDFEDSGFQARWLAGGGV